MSIPLVLSEPNPAQLSDRLTGLETWVNAKSSLSLTGTHAYALGCGGPLATTTGTDTTGIANQIWINEVRISENVTLTGVSYLIGTAGGTDKAIAILFDSLGNVVANSALAGTTVGTLATFQRLAFTAPVSVGPGLYYVAIQTSGTTAHIRTVPFGDHNTGVVAGSAMSSSTPIAAITPPTSFTASSGPIAMLY